MRSPGLRSLLLASLAVLTALASCAGVTDNSTHKALSHSGNDDQYQLISTSEPTRTKGSRPQGPQGPQVPEDKVASSDLPLADKQYDYPLVRPVYAPFVTRPSVASWPYVEILDHNRNPSVIVTQKPPNHYIGNPMVSTVVVQDMSQTASPQPPLSLNDFHHLGPNKIPFTDVQVMTKPIREKPTAADDKQDQIFTDKFEETSLEDNASEYSEEDDSSELLENPPNLDVGGIVENVLKTVFREKQVLRDTEDLIPQPDVGVKTWPCPPVTCCSSESPPKCSTFVNCVAGKSVKMVPGMQPCQARPLAEPLGSRAEQLGRTAYHHGARE